MTLNEIRNSGLLELYVIGDLEERDLNTVTAVIGKYPVLKQDLYDIERAMANYAFAHAVAPAVAVKTLLMATVDYVERMKSGEAPSFPPLLTENSKIADFQEWIEQEDMIAPADFEEMYAKIIAHEPEKLTAIIWLQDRAADETHTDEYEKFLILEGTCEITIGTEVHQLGVGDYLSIPLFINHVVKVTSDIPCKILLQRVAA